MITTALKLKPNDGFYLDSLGWLYYQKGDFKKAHMTLEQAVKMEPNEGVIFEHLGDVKKAMGEKAAAHSMYEKALHSSIEDSDKQRIEKKAKDTQ